MASAATEISRAELEDACTCWVCFEMFVEPLTLYCGHTFCKDCVVQVYKKNPACPFCRKPFGLPLPPVSQSVMKLVRRLRDSKAGAAPDGDVDMAPPSSGAQAAPRGDGSALLLLGPELLREILVRAGPQAVARSSRACRTLHSACEDQLLWRALCQERWPFCSVDRHRSWKRAFAANRAVARGWDGGRAGDFTVRTFRGHTDYVSAFQLYRSVIVSASADSTVKVWRSSNSGSDEDPTPTRTLEGHEGPVHCLQFNEATTATGGADSTVRLWDTATGIPLHVLRCVAPVRCVRFDDGRLLCGLENGQLKQWDPKTGEAVRTLPGHAGQRVAALDLDAREFFSCAVDGVRVWDAASGRNRLTMPTNAACMARAFNDVITGDLDGSVRVWSAINGTMTDRLQHTPGHPITDVACNGRHIVSASEDGTIKVWDFATKALLHTMADHKAAVNSVQLDDKKVVSAGADMAIKVWNLATGTRMYTLLGGSLQRRANNPPHPTRAGVSGVTYDETRIAASINSLMRIYDFECLPAEAPAAN